MRVAPGSVDEQPTAVRAPNHLGELILALPALERLCRGTRPVRPVVQVLSMLTPVLEMADLGVEVLPLPGRHRVFRAAWELRRRGCARGVLLTPSFSAALTFFLAGLESRRGVVADGRRLLLTDRVDRDPLLEGHRVLEYLTLVDPRQDRPVGSAPRPAGTGSRPGAEIRHALSYPGSDRLPRPSIRPGDGVREAWAALVERRGLPRGGELRTVGLVPGGNAPSRRWPAERYGELARRLAGDGTRVLGFGGPGDRDVTAAVAGDRDGVFDLGGRTSLFELAGGLLAADAVVANDTGAAHLAAALGRPLLALWGAGDPRQTRPLSSRAWLMGAFALSCVPCVENRCPRSGQGYVLARAERECMHLVRVDSVARALQNLLRGRGASETAGAGEKPP